MTKHIQPLNIVGSSLELIGKTFKNKIGLAYTVLRHLNNSEYLIVFHNTGYITSAFRSGMRTGYVRDHYEPYRYGVGYIGRGNNSNTDTFKVRTTTCEIRTSTTGIYRNNISQIRC